MQFWRLCLVAAVLALSSDVLAQGDGDGDEEDDGAVGDGDDTLGDGDSTPDVGEQGDQGDGDEEEGAGDGAGDDGADDAGEDVQVAGVSADDLKLSDQEQVLFATEETQAAVYSDKCFRCLYEGYSFCSEDGGLTGTCQPAFCLEIKEDPENPIIEKPGCTLRGNKCEAQTILSFSECWKTEFDSKNCIDDVSITRTDLDAAEVNAKALEEQAVDPVKRQDQPIPLMTEVPITIEKGTGCKFVVSTAIGDPDKVGFQVVERHDNVLGVITVVDSVLEYDENTTELSSEKTSDFAKEYAGNVLVKPKHEYHVLFFNTDSNDQTV